jgi:hypothetical protein
MTPGRRPKAARVVYDQGDCMFTFQIVPIEDREVLRMTLAHKQFGGSSITTAQLTEPELIVTISKLFEMLINLQARNR